MSGYPLDSNEVIGSTQVHFNINNQSNRRGNTISLAIKEICDKFEKHFKSFGYIRNNHYDIDYAYSYVNIALTTSRFNSIDITSLLNPIIDEYNPFIKEDTKRLKIVNDNNRNCIVVQIPNDLTHDDIDFNGKNRKISRTPYCEVKLILLIIFLIFVTYMIYKNIHSYVFKYILFKNE